MILEARQVFSQKMKMGPQLDDVDELSVLEERSTDNPKRTLPSGSMKFLPRLSSIPRIDPCPIPGRISDLLKGL